MPSSPTIPLIYRIFFPTLDPTLATIGVISTLFSRKTFLVSYFPNPTVNHETRFALDALVGFFASTIVLQGFLLRLRPDDIAIWKTLQTSILLQNACMLGAFLRVKAREGMLDPRAWTRTEWGKQVGVLGAATVRIAFLLGVGL